MCYPSVRNVSLEYLRHLGKSICEFRVFVETLNGRLPPEHGSDRHETWPKRVSDDSQRFIFRRRKKIVREKF